MDKKLKEKYLKELQKIEAKHTQPTNEISLLDRISKQLSLLIRISVEKNQDSLKSRRIK